MHACCAGQQPTVGREVHATDVIGRDADLTQFRARREVPPQPHGPIFAAVASSSPSGQKASESLAYVRLLIGRSRCRPSGSQSGP